MCLEVFDLDIGINRTWDVTQEKWSGLSWKLQPLVVIHHIIMKP